jgi:hypothetical protein
MIHAAGARCAGSMGTRMSTHEIYRSLRDRRLRNRIGRDPLGSSGTTMPAAECTGRLARVIELAPPHVDIAIRRWEQITPIPARHGCGLSLSETAAKRGFDPVFERAGMGGSQES